MMMKTKRKMARPPALAAAVIAVTAAKTRPKRCCGNASPMAKSTRKNTSPENLSSKTNPRDPFAAPVRLAPGRFFFRGRSVEVKSRLSSALGEKGEQPNLKLADKIVGTTDTDAVAELIHLLDSGPRPIQNDAIKVLNEIGSRVPALISGHTKAFLGRCFGSWRQWLIASHPHPHLAPPARLR